MHDNAARDTRTAFVPVAGSDMLAAPIQAIYAALETVTQAARLILVPISPPMGSPESNGMAEVFVSTLRRDHLDGVHRSSAGRVFEEPPRWIADHKENAPPSALIAT